MAKRKVKEGFVKKTTHDRLVKAETVLNNDDYVNAKDEFLSKFTLCEIACKSIISYYNQVQGKTIGNKLIKLDMRTIPSAMSFFHYNVDKHVLTLIFGSSQKRDSKSAKKIRDCIVHAFSEEDIKELISRKSELLENMDLFLERIRET